jgi:hypothetical protein
MKRMKTNSKTDEKNLTVTDVARQMGVTVVRVSEDPDRLMIRRQLAMPPNKRTNFLRKRLSTGGSAL